MIKIVSPTGMPVRGHDAWSSGAFGAPRGRKKHRGCDFLCVPDATVVVSPSLLRVVREARPYPDEPYSGILLEDLCGLYQLKMFYLEPFDRILEAGLTVLPKQPIGIAQDITKRDLPKKYIGMQPHIHLEIELNRDHLIPRPRDAIFIDPEKLL